MEHEKPISPWQEWKIIEKIGEGSYGKVYKAERTEQGRSFYSALKIIPIPSNRGELSSVRLEAGGEDSVREYFKNIVDECIQEISTMEYFRGNSHIVSVEDFKVVEYLDEIGWDIYIRMEYLKSFLDFCTGRELTEREIIKLGIDLCKALEYCGQLRIIHRDIKPENIFVSRFGDFKLGDFGIARELERTMGSMSKKGTFSYMAPEMYRGEAYDSSVDLYSLGIVLYKLMNRNRLPFLSLDKQLITFHDKENALNRRMSGELLPRPVDASEELSEIILRACAFDIKERYQDPEMMREDLERLRRGEYIAGSPAKAVGLSSGEKKQSLQTREAYVPVQDPEPESVFDIPLPEDTFDETGEVKIPLWVWVVLIVGICMALVAGVWFGLRSGNTSDQSAPAGQVVNALEINDSSTAQIDDFSTSISQIKDQATAVVEMLPNCTEKGSEGSYLYYYDDSSKLVKALLYPAASESGKYEEYYYWDEQLFFVYVWDETGNELCYFNPLGSMIRWIDTDGFVHDLEHENPEYEYRAEHYLETAAVQMRLAVGELE